MEGQEPEERPELGDRVLERRAGQPPAAAADERLEVTRGQRRQPCRRVLVGQVSQQLRGGPQVLPPRHRLQPADVVQVGRVHRELGSRPGRRLGRGGWQGMLDSEVALHRVGGACQLRITVAARRRAGAELSARHLAQVPQTASAS